MTSPSLARAFVWRQDLRVSPRALFGRPGYLVEDPASGRFHRLGPLEYHTLRRLSANCAAAKATQLAAEEVGASPLPAEAMAALIRWGLMNELLEVVEIEPAASHESRIKNITPTQPAKQPHFDPFAFRISFGSPERLLAPLVARTGWLFARHTAVFALLAIAWLLVQIGAQWDSFAASIGSLWLPQQQLWLIACWLLLKLVHEAAHGIACLRFGGDVRDAGISINFGAPLPYVDVTSSWRFNSRWERIVVAGAGMYVECLLAIAAGFIWLGCEDPAVRRLCAYVITVAAAGTILFNANPLVRFDGYYIFSDLIDYPNLATRAQQFWQQVWLRWGCGVPTEFAWSTREGLGLAGYGVLSMLWRCGTLLALAIGAVELYEGFGIALVVLAGCLWFGRTAGQVVALVVRSWQSGPRAMLQPAIVLTSFTVIAGLLISFFPSPFTPQLWGVARHADEIDVRTIVAGSVDRVLVIDGAQVAAGDLLAILSNDELQIELSELRGDVGRSEVKVRQLQQKQELVKWQVELEHLAGLKQQLTEKEREANGLKIIAPQAGTVFAPRLDELTGRFLKRGDAVCAIGSPVRKEVVVAIPQDRLPEFINREHTSVFVSVPGRQVIHGEIEAVEPRATSEPHDWSLATTNGGPLAVQQVKQEDAGSQWQLLTPHFTAKVSIDDDGSHLAAGQRCRVVRAEDYTTLGEWLRDQCVAWAERHRATR